MPYFGEKIDISPVLFSGKHGNHYLHYNDVKYFLEDDNLIFVTSKIRYLKSWLVVMNLRIAIEILKFPGSGIRLNEHFNYSNSKVLVFGFKYIRVDNNKR